VRSVARSRPSLESQLHRIGRDLKVIVADRLGTAVEEEADMPRSTGNAPGIRRDARRSGGNSSEVAEPPVRLVMVMTMLGVLVGALIAPADSGADGPTGAREDPAPTLIDQMTTGENAPRLGDRAS
jgi:hypothetical protein